MINDFMPDITSIDIREDNDTFYQVVIRVDSDPNRPYEYQITCDYDSKRNKVYWIVFREYLYPIPNLRYPRYRVSLFNYPTDTMDSAIENVYNCIVGHYTMNNRG